MEKNYWQLRKEVENHPGFMYRGSRRTHNNSLNIYGGNFRDISGFIDLIEKPESYFKGGWHDKKRQGELFSELHRFFHNYVAASESLVSHTRSYIKHHHDSDEIGKAYKEEIKNTFTEHAPTVVVKDFRNYFLHKGLPRSSIHTTLQLDGTPPTIHILFSVEELLEWKKWSSLSKKYLNDQGENLRLRKLVVNYHNNVLNFYHWFDKVLENWHQEEVSEMEKLASKVITLENENR